MIAATAGAWRFDVRASAPGSTPSRPSANRYRAEVLKKAMAQAKEPVTMRISISVVAHAPTYRSVSG